MFKKILAWILVVSLTAAIAIGGTLAYLTDRDSVANIFTVGNVNITLEEEFEQESQLKPGVDINKDVQIKNEGPNDAWVWYTYAIPAALDTPEDASANALHVNHAGANWLGYQNNEKYWAEGQTEATPEDQCWIPDYNPAGNGQPVGTVEVEGIVYNVYAVLYNGILPADETTTVGMTKVYLDSTVDITPDGDLYKVVAGETTEIGWNVNDNENPVIFINAYAIQTQDFETVQDAYAAFEGQWGDMIGAGTYEVNKADTWDGTSDTSWYNNTDTEFVITTAEQLAGLSELVDGGNTFEGKTVKLSQNIDLYHLADGATDPTCFDPIGSYRKDAGFKGTFDGQNHTISNMSQNTWALDNGYYYTDCGLGLFGQLEGANVKNLTMDNASVSGESAICGAVAACAHNTTFENITVKNSDVADYQYYAGGIVGWASGETSFIGCNVDASTTVATQWGDFNNATGGVIGGISTSADILMKDTTVACRIDVHNDIVSAYGWYSYRSAGMLIGNTGQKDDPDGDNVGDAIAPNLTCENVTVIYGDWANYHYCYFGAMGYPWVRVEAGVSCGAYSNVRYGHPTDANGNEVVDANHVHNDGEAHHELIVFDQLYGGTSGARYCTYGTATHEGVTVIYNNK